MPREIEAALRILSGSGGRFLGVPGGTTGQRPAGAAGRFRRNTTTGVLEYHNGSGWVSLLEAGAVTFAAVAGQWRMWGRYAHQDDAARGNHNRPFDGFDTRSVSSGTIAAQQLCY